MSSPFGRGPYGKGRYARADAVALMDVGGLTGIRSDASARLTATGTIEIGGATSITWAISARPVIEVVVQGWARIDFYVDALLEVTWPDYAPCEKGAWEPVDLDLTDEGWPGYAPCMPGAWAPVDLANRVPVP